MSELQTPRRGLTGRALVIGLTLVLVWLVYDCTLAVDSGLNSIEVLYLIGFGAIFTMFAVTMANNALAESRRLTRQELTVIYAMVAVAIPWGILIRGAIEAPMKMLILHTSPSDLSVRFLTELWVSKSYDAREMFRAGGVGPGEILWRHWRTPILYWSAILLAFQLFAFSVVLFLRRLFVDHEKLPFPLAQAAAGIIEYRPSASTEQSEGKFRAAVHVAFLAGLLFCLPGILSITPDSHNPIPMSSDYYGTKTGIIPGLSITLSWDPFVLCFLMFFPLDVLLTMMLFYVVPHILVPVVCQWLGIPVTDISSFTLNVFGMGGLVGLAFWTIFFNRRLLWDGVRRALHPTAPAPGDEPVSFRVVLLGMGLSFAVFMTLFVVGVVDRSVPFTETDFCRNFPRHLISLAVTVFILVTMVVAILRQTGECGWNYHSPWSVGKVLAYVHHHYLKHPQSLFQTQASFLTLSHVIHFGAYHNTFGPHLHVMNALKMASATGTRTRDVMKAALLTLVLSVIVVVPLYLVAVHHYGFARGSTMNDWYNFWNYSEPQHGIAYNAIPSIFNRFNPAFSVALGVTIIGVVMYLRRERVGFPLSPVGVVISTGLSYFRNYSTPTIWFAVLIVLVTKHLIYRWFGVGFFRRRVIPVVLFMMMGLMTGMFVYKMIFAALGRGFMRPY